MPAEYGHGTNPIRWVNASPKRILSTATDPPVESDIIASLGRDTPSEGASLAATSSYWVIPVGSASTMLLRFAVGHASAAASKFAQALILGAAPEGPILKGADSSLKGIYSAHVIGSASLQASASAASVQAKSLMNPATAPASFKWVSNITQIVNMGLDPGVRLVFQDTAGSPVWTNGISALHLDCLGFSHILVAGWCAVHGSESGTAAASVGCQYAHLGG